MFNYIIFKTLAKNLHFCINLNFSKIQDGGDLGCHFK